MLEAGMQVGILNEKQLKPHEVFLATYDTPCVPEGAEGALRNALLTLQLSSNSIWGHDFEVGHGAKRYRARIVCDLSLGGYYMLEKFELITGV